MNLVEAHKTCSKFDLKEDVLTILSIESSTDHSSNTWANILVSGNFILEKLVLFHSYVYFL